MHSPTRRPGQTLNVTFVLPDNAFPARLRQWSALLENPERPGILRFGAEHAAASGEDWLREVLTLARTFLQILRVPIFDPIGILSCNPPSDRSKKWSADLILPQPHLVTPAVLADVLKKAFRIAPALIGRETGDQRQREFLYNFVQTEIINPNTKSAAARRKSTLEVLRAAHAAEIPCTRIAGQIWQLGWGRNGRFLDGSTTDRDSATGAYLTRNKALTATLLRRAGLPAPVHQLLGDLAEARKFADVIGYPVVVKPADGERGEGVSVDVYPDGFETAFSAARKVSASRMVLTEKQVPGICHRIFIAAGEVLYAVKRLPMGIYGDGAATIEAIIRREIESQKTLPPWSRYGICPLDETALAMLAAQGYTPSSVAAEGAFVALRRIETTALGGIDENVTSLLHPDIAEAARQAAALLNLEVAGVDVITEDISRSWRAVPAIINEVNYAPLLGEGKISRSYVPAYLQRIVPDKGLIPLKVFAGGDEAAGAAKETWHQLVRSGLRYHLIGGGQACDHRGADIAPQVPGQRDLNDLVSCSLLRRDTDGVILFLAPEEINLLSPDFRRHATLMGPAEDAAAFFCPPPVAVRTEEQARNKP